MRNELSYNSYYGLFSIRAKRDQVKGPTKNRTMSPAHPSVWIDRFRGFDIDQLSGPVFTIMYKSKALTTIPKQRKPIKTRKKR